MIAAVGATLSVLGFAQTLPQRVKCVQVRVENAIFKTRSKTDAAS